jgi:RsiW-degrading membrane proteinase PrsW (M82 family)
MKTTGRRDALDIILLVGSIFAVTISIVAAGSMAIIAGLSNVLQLIDNAQSAWAIALIFSAMGLLTIPGLYLSFRSVSGNSPLVSRSISPVFLLVGAGYPLAIALGILSRELDFLPYLLEPAAHVAAALTPMLFMSIYVVRRLPVIPWRRIWGQFSGGLWLSPMVALILELLAALPFLILLFAYVLTEVDPRELIDPLTSGAQLDENYIQAQLQFLSDQPLLVITAILFVTVLVPLLEELIKTIALWPMLRRGLSPLYAFVGGAVAGGAYGLFEAFFLVQPGEGWASLMIARAGATLMHMITTGMAGLGLSLAIQRKRWTTALRYYFYAVLLHGFWNFAAIGVGVAYLFQETGANGSVYNHFTPVVVGSAVVLSLLAAGAAYGLHAFPQYLLQREPLTPDQEASAGVS